MNDWFTTQEIDSDTFAISEYKHWEETHSYLLLGQKRAVLIDTGLGISDISEAVRSITELPVTVITTHIHWDHIGGHKYFDDIAVFHSEKEWLENFPIPLQTVKNNIMRMPCELPKDFNIDSYEIFSGKPQRVFYDGDITDLGNRQIMAIHTPGHSPGHCCFYEPLKKYLYSGDLIYSGCLDAFYPTTDPLLFQKSVQKIGKLDIKRILPAHHRIDIPVGMIDKISKAFARLSDKGKLKQGEGIFDFGDFQIHI